MALLGIGLLAGCASTELSEADLLEQRRVINEASGPAVPLAPQTKGSREDAERAVEKATGELDSGDPRAALDTIRLALLQAPPPDQAATLRELRVLAKRAFLRAAVATAEAVADADRITEGDTLLVRVRIRNLSPVPLRIADPRSGFSPTTARLTVMRTAIDVFGNRRSDSWEELVPFGADVAGPGGTLETSLELDTSRFMHAFPRGFVEYSFEGFVLPSAVTAGDVEIHDRIAVSPAVVASFPEGWRSIADDPVAALRRGLEVGNPVRILVAARCAGPGLRDAMGLVLARRTLDVPPLEGAMATGVRRALCILAGVEDGDDWPPERWEARAGEDTLFPGNGETER